MRRNKNLLRKAAAVAMMATMVVGSTATNAFAYGEYSTSGNTFHAETDGSSDFTTWLNTVWNAGASAQSDQMALTPGEDEADLNFAWYSENKGVPAVMIWKDGAKAAAKVVEGTATEIDSENWQGETYTAANHVTIADYFEAGMQYHYQYTANYTGDTTAWSSEYDYKTSDSAEEFSVILTGDPQVGASGSSSDASDQDSSVARDTYNWNKTMTKALEVCPDAAFLLSAGDQIDKSGASSEDNLKTRESEYAGYLYPSVFRSLPIASTIGNHDTAGVDYSNHFNNPNTEDNLGATAAGSDYYFSYGEALFISLNSNNRNQSEHRALMTKALESNPDAKWKVVVFHSDIYGSGQPHADTDAATNRVIFAPLMDEFDIDVCLTGHDHTFSRSYQILDGTVVDYEISDGVVENPEGTLYITTGSGSGSKYYDLLNYTPYYIAERTNALLPSFSTIDFTNGSLTIKTYDYNGNKYADDFTITKSTEDLTIDEIIANAEAKLTETGYTQESLASLANAVAALKTMQASYTTATDPLAAVMSTAYGTETDFIRGYGSIKNDTDKDVILGNDGTERLANRLKKGMSTLLDKTIYTQLENGAALANAVTPEVDGTAIANAKTAVVAAMEALVVAEPNTGDSGDAGNTGDTGVGNTGENVVGNQTNTGEVAANEESVADSTPKTGDRAPFKILALGMTMAAALGGAVVLTRKKEEQWER